MTPYAALRVEVNSLVEAVLEERKLRKQAEARVKELEEDWAHVHGVAAQKEVRLAEAVVWGVEWGIKHFTQREEFPVSWDAGFPGYKAQALLEWWAQSDAGEIKSLLLTQPPPM